MLEKTYRPDIDGLRTIAVLGVILFHAFPNSPFSGGYIGVDIFFVISGFLITSILLREQQTNTFSILRFYQRRVLRIFPALCLVLLSVLVVGFYLLLPSEYAALGKHVASGALFSANFAYWYEAGYFDTSSEFKPLLHLWSLGVEEQFYIVWPLLLAMTHHRPKLFRLMLCCTGLTSFSASVYLTYTHPAAAFFAPFSRYWELMAGGALAYWIRNGSLGVAHLKSPLAILGAFLCLAPMLILAKDALFPGWVAALPVFGAALLIASGPSAWFNRVVLSSFLFRSIGLISYPLYLWHWPLLAYLHITQDGKPSTEKVAMAIVATFMLSIATYFLLEKPLRSKSHSGAGKKMGGLVFVMVIACALGINVYHRDGMAFRLMKISPELTGKKPDIQAEWRTGRCFLEESSTFSPECLEAKKGKAETVFLWGDSHAASLYPGLRSLQEKADMRISQYTTSGCEPYPGLTLPNQLYCNEANRENMQRVRSLQPTLVILHSRWLNKLAPQGLAQALDMIKQASPHSKILVIGASPTWNDELPRILFRRYRSEGDKPSDYLPDNDASKVRYQDEQLRKIVISKGGIFASSVQVLCRQEGCLTRVYKPQPMISSMDSGHLTPEAAKYLVAHLKNLIVNEPI
ncbi:acyltransferase family protein [Chromobacterium vaccinii]|uniref:acyltransferase family protein n=1 Tax=Chromobacterium vaccinii TaxID=1108595 RepID=UPI003C71046C